MESLKKAAQSVWPYIQIIAVAVLLAINYHFFIVRNGFAPAGINGIATMIQYKTGFSISYMTLLINVPLCLLAYFLINKDFAKKSFCFCLVYSGVYLALQQTELSFLQYDAHGHDTVFPVIISGLISGLVYGVCMRLNASTGGTDIVSKYISTKKPRLNFFWITFTLNAVVAAASFVVYAETAADGTMIFNYKPVCLCILYCFISSYMGNTIIRGTKKAYKFTVITTHAEEINSEVIQHLHHSTTQIQAIGSYTHGARDVLICVVNAYQVTDFQNILKKYDNTFAFSEMVNETYGNFVRVKS